MTYEIDLKSEKTTTEPVSLKISIENITKGFTIEKSPCTLYLDYDKVASTMEVRKWQKGDWFIPFGMKGRKKLSDYFSNNKFSLFDKENAWILCSGEDIVWLIGHRSDDRFKITTNTEKVVKIVLEN